MRSIESFLYRTFIEKIPEIIPCTSDNSLERDKIKKYLTVEGKRDQDFVSEFVDTQIFSYSLDVRNSEKEKANG